MHIHLERALAGVTDEMLAQVDTFLAARKARHGDLRMEAGDDTADGGQDDTDDHGDDGDGQDDDGADQLQDKGKQALDRMKTQRNQFRDQLREFQALGLTPEQIRALQKPAGDDDKPDPDAIREQARREARAEANRERVVDKIEAKAAREFADPEDAVAILLRGRDAADFLDGEKVDVEEIESALKELLEKKPHLAAQRGRKFQGGADGGARKETAKPEPTPGLGRLRAAYADS